MVTVSPLQSVCDRNPVKELLKAIPSGLGRHQASPPPSTDDIQDESMAFVICKVLFSSFAAFKSHHSTHPSLYLHLPPHHSTL